jgi:protein-S-isoprenylcysteine O-methyltransferase Ste14
MIVSTLTGYLLVFVYLLSDARLRKGEKARRVAADSSDRQSTYRLVQAFGLSILLFLLAPLLNYFRLGRAGAGLFPGWLGVGLMVGGMALRAWSTRLLGRFYTRTLQIDAGQHIVQAGPYRLVRHPGYSGSLLVWIGASLATANWIVFALVSLVCIIVYIYRIRSEEIMLVARFGTEYEAYIRRTKRLIPYVY